MNLLLHDWINIILLVLLIGFVFYEYYVTYFAESFCNCSPYTSNYTHKLAPFHNNENSVYSSLPPQANQDSSWKYTTPYQQTCMEGCPDKCKKGQEFVCRLTPHNQRVCKWQ
jgi:hypothetical protein